MYTQTQIKGKGGGKKGAAGAAGAGGGGVPKALGLKGGRDVGKKDLWLQAHIASCDVSGKELREVTSSLPFSLPPSLPPSLLQGPLSWHHPSH